jgi:hypothetical protein
MRRLFVLWIMIAGLAGALPVQAATGRVIKVLPQFLDLKGRNSLLPGLYDRDTYQLMLRQHPEKCSGMRFHVQWKAKGPTQEPLKLRIELRGTAAGNLPQQLVLEQPLPGAGHFSHWAEATLDGDAYKRFGAVTAWRVTLWEGAQILGEQKSFLW